MLVDILHITQKLNKQRNITGMLLRAQGNVLQVVEGEEEDVRNTFQAIELDPRHRDFFVLSRQVSTERHFDEWTVGFSKLSEANLGRHPIAALILNANVEEIAQRVKPGSSLALLELFAQIIEVVDKGLMRQPRRRSIKSLRRALRHYFQLLSAKCV
jgi:hypothetical protein